MRASRGIRRRGVAAAALLIAATCVVGAAAAGRQAQAGPAYKKIGSWGKRGTGNGQFQGNAYGITTDKSGKVYVADTDNSRVQVFTASGGFVRKLQFSPGSFVQDAAVAPDGSSWATDLNGAKGQQFSSAGGALASVDTPKTARGIAVDAKGNVFIATAGDNVKQVGRYDKTATGWEPGMTLGGFKDPHDVEASPDGTVYVSDNGSLTVKRFDANGRLLKAIKAGPSTPIGIGVDLDCNVWLTNIAQRRVDKVSPSGKLLASVTAGDLIAQDVAIGPKGDLYVFDNGTGSIVRFAEDRTNPAAAAVSGAVVVSKGVAKVKYSLSGVACPAQLSATASLSGSGISGKATVKVVAGKANVIAIPVKTSSSASSARFTIVLKTNGRPTTQVRDVGVSVR
jgi:sugar lactone lactonase YvrE